MKDVNQIKTCCAERTATKSRLSWSIGTSSSSREAGYRLSIALWIDHSRFIKHIFDGMLFETSEAANQFLFEHGFTQEYRVGFCPKHRKQHFFCGGRSNCAEEHGSPKSYQVQFDRESKKIHKQRAEQEKWTSAYRKANPSAGYIAAHEAYYEEIRKGA